MLYTKVIKKVEVVDICGVKFDNWKIDDFSEYLSRGVHRNGKAITIVTPNVDFLVLANKDRYFRKILNEADYGVCDSAIVHFTSRIIGKKIHSRITGCDVMEILLQVADSKKEKIFLFGSTAERNKLAASNIAARYPNLIIAGRRNGYFNAQESEAIIDMINESGADYLFLGLGSPLQEKWAYKWRARLKVNIIVSVGGALDIWSGKVKRSPVFLQKLGLEWFWRFLQAPPTMFTRYFINDLQFFPMLLKQHFNRKKPIDSGLKHTVV